MKIFPMARSGGFSLVEVTLALGVAGFCLLAIHGLLQTGLISERSTVEQTVATGIMTDIYADLAATPVANKGSAILGLDFSNTSPQIRFFSGSGSSALAMASDSRYRATILLQPVTNGASQARIVVSWPAAADRSASGWPTNATGSVETVTTLRRN